MSGNSSATPLSSEGMDLPSVSFQKSVIASNINSSMILTFLMGIYTMVYIHIFHLYSVCGTPYSVITHSPKRPPKCMGYDSFDCILKPIAKDKKNLSPESPSASAAKRGNAVPPRHAVSKVPIIAITGLYTICLSIFGLNWYYLEWVMVEQGDTRTSIFAGSLGEAPNWFIIIMSLLQYSEFVIADGLLMWRCYNVWNRSAYVIGVLLPLLLTEIALGIATTAYSVLIPVITSVPQANLANNVQAAAPFVSFGTTVFTTTLIAYRIHSTTRLGGVISSLERFQHIMIVLLESAAAYSVVLLFWAILSVIPASFNITTQSPVYFSTFYVYAVLVITGGLAPTIVVARIAISEEAASNAAWSASTQISGLRFHNEGSADSHNEKPDV